MVYQRLDKVIILPEMELKLDLVGEALKILIYWQENLFDTNFFRWNGRSRVYLFSFIKNNRAQFEYVLLHDPKLILYWENTVH